MTYSMLTATMLCMWTITSHADMGFDSKYERDYNIFNPASGAIPEAAVGFLRWRQSRDGSTEACIPFKSLTPTPNGGWPLF